MSDWPKYYHDKLYLGDPKSTVGLLTLWTVKEKICEKLPKESFKVAGQMYSKQGISFLLRNILASPSVRSIIVCGRDYTKAGEALLALSKNGVDKDHKIIGISDAQLDKSIPLKKIKLVRENVEFIDLIGEDDPGKILRALKKCNPGKPFAKGETFPMPAIKRTDKLSSEEGAQVVRAKYVREVWPQMLRRLLMFGSESRHFHGSMVKEIFNFTAIITDEDVQKPEIISEFGFSKKELADYIDNFLSPQKGKEEYTYGSRMQKFKGINQIDEIIRKLKGYENDRGALAVLWDPTEDNKPKKVPCMTAIQANGEGDKIHLTAYFRSNDMFNGWPRNAFALRALQKKITDKLGKKIGWLTTISSCAHIYENEWMNAQEVVDHYSDVGRMIPDPRGNVLVFIDKKNILVKQLAPSSEVLREFKFDGTKPKAAYVIGRRLWKAELFGSISHALDIGSELQKAEIAIKSGKKYEQDKNWE